MATSPVTGAIVGRLISSLQIYHGIFSVKKIVNRLKLKELWL